MRGGGRSSSEDSKVARARVPIENAAGAHRANNNIEDENWAYYAPEFIKILGEACKSMFESPKLRWYIYSSNVPALAYIGFSFFLLLSLFLLYEYKDTDHLISFIGQFIFAVALEVTNGVMTYLMLRSKEIHMAGCLFALVITLSSLSPSVLLAFYYLYFYNIVYFIITLVLSVLSLNVAGLSMIIVFILFLLLVILAVCELLLYHFKELCYCLCTKKESKSRVALSTFHYDKNKTEATECIICLQDYKDGELICRGKCHVSHIAHEKCMLSWVEVKKTCPVCGVPIELS